MSVSLLAKAEERASVKRKKRLFKRVYGLAVFLRKSVKTLMQSLLLLAL